MNKNLIPTIRLNLCLPEDLYGRVTIFLFSPLENRVPKGGYQEFFVRLIRDFFESKSLDIAPWAGTDPGACIIRGRPETLEILKKTLRGEFN